MPACAASLIRLVLAGLCPVSVGCLAVRYPPTAPVPACSGPAGSLRDADLAPTDVLDWLQRTSTKRFAVSRSATEFATRPSAPATSGAESKVGA